MKTGAELIQDERLEQQVKHGYDSYHDSAINSDGQLVDAATIIANIETMTIHDWREIGWNDDRYYHIKKKSKVEQLAIAGALIAAEIDRLNEI